MKASRILAVINLATSMTWKPNPTEIPAREFTIQSFQREHVPELLALMKGLAAFEDYRDAFAVEERDIIERGLAPEPEFYAKVAVSAEETLLGMAVYYLIPYTYDLHPDLVLKELFVHPDARGMGIGQALMRDLVETATKNDCKRIKWLVLSTNEPAKHFYKTLGGQRDEKWELWQLQVAPAMNNGG